MRCFNTRIYGGEQLFQYWTKMREVLGFRLLPYSVFSLETGSNVLGLRSYQQLAQLAQKDKYRFMRANFSNE